MEPPSPEPPPLAAALVEPLPMDASSGAAPFEPTLLDDGPPEPPPSREPSDGGDGIETPTMAELYASQGHFDKAVAVYRNLLARDPNETQYLERIEELEMLAKASADSASAVPAEPAELRGDGLSDSSRQQTIEILEQWLEGIRRSRRA
jgi:hypothetical protein